MKTIVFSISIILLVVAYNDFGLCQDIPEETKRYFIHGITATEMASSIDDYRNAIRSFEKAISLAPDWPDVYYNLGLLYGKTGNYEKAIQNLKKYLELTPNSSDSKQVREYIYKLEYKRKRSNIEGVWGIWEKSHMNEFRVSCSQRSHMTKRKEEEGLSLTSIALMDIEIVKTSDGYKARFLNWARRYGDVKPDGHFVKLQKEGDLIKIYDAVMYTCEKSLDSRNCPWTVTLKLEHISKNKLKGTIDIVGIAYRWDWNTRRIIGPVSQTCEGEISFIRKKDAQ